MAENRVSLRLTSELLRKLAARVDESGMTLSECIRVLLETSLRESEESRVAAAEIAAMKQGVLRGLAMVDRRLQQTLKEILSEVGDAQR